MTAEGSLLKNNSQRRIPAGIILAAGTSTRMGTPKQLLSTGKRSLLASVLKETLDSDLEKVVLVLGHRAEEIESTLGSALKNPKLQITYNPRYKEGISTSIIAGLTIVEKMHDHVMIILADMPNINAHLINNLLNQYIESKFSMGAVSIKGKRSHPVIFGRKHYIELHHLKGDKGARELFQKYPRGVFLLEAGESFDDRDIDTPEDYKEFKKGIPFNQK